MQDLHYRQSARHRKTGLVISIISTIAGTIIMATAGEVKNWQTRIGLFFAVFGILVLIKVIRNKVMVEVNPHGIKTPHHPGGLVSWKYIDGFELVKAPLGTSIAAKINDVNALMKEPGLRKWMMNSNLRRTGYPIIFTHQFFDKPVEEVIIELENYRQSLGTGKPVADKSDMEVI